MVPLIVPEEQWGPRSWGVNHPLYARAQIEHGLQEAGYGYWGFSPSDNPSGGYREYGVDAIGMNADGYTSNNDNTLVDHGFGDCRPPKPDPTTYTNGVVTPHASFLALGFARQAALANLAKLRRDFAVYGPEASSTPSTCRRVRARHWLALDQGMVMAALDRASLRSYLSPSLEPAVQPLLAPRSSPLASLGRMALPLDHCVVHVSDWAASNAFYHEVLGAGARAARRGLAYRFGRQQLNLHGPGSIAPARARAGAARRERSVLVGRRHRGRRRAPRELRRADRARSGRAPRRRAARPLGLLPRPRRQPRVHRVQRVTAVIFDCDGTLVDSEPLAERAWALALARHGYELAPDDLAGAQGLPFLEVRAHGPAHAAAGARGVLARVRGGAPAPLDSELEPFDDAIATVRELYARGVPLAVASSSRRERLRPHLGARRAR